jgi:heme exporter protein C
MALRSSIDDPRRGDRASAILLIVGVVNVPIIYYSVKWWNTLHQGSTIKLNEESSMDDTMLLAMLIMTLGFWAYSIATAMSRVRSVILERERSSTWVKQMIAEEHRDA